MQVSTQNSFLVADTRLYTLPCRSVSNIFESQAFFALLPLPNRPRLSCRVSGLVSLGNGTSLNENLFFHFHNPYRSWFRSTKWNICDKFHFYCQKWWKSFAYPSPLLNWTSSFWGSTIVSHFAELIQIWFRLSDHSCKRNE